MHQTPATTSAPAPHPMTLRPATPEDIPLILRMIAELAEYEKAPEQALATPAQMHAALFGATSGRAPLAECVIGEIDGEAQGFALFFLNFSTWTGRAGLYLEDLFVRPTARGKGLGKALLLRLARIAVDRGCGRMEWSVLDWNTPALDFYKALGAVKMDEWTVHRVAGPALVELARQDR